MNSRNKEDLTPIRRVDVGTRIGDGMRRRQVVDALKRRLDLIGTSPNSRKEPEADKPQDPEKKGNGLKSIEDLRGSGY